MVAEIQTVYNILAKRLKTDIPAPWSLRGPSSFPRSKIEGNVMKHAGEMFDKTWGTNGSLDPRAKRKTISATPCTTMAPFRTMGPQYNVQYNVVGAIRTHPARFLYYYKC